MCHQTGQIRCYQHACTYLLSWYGVSSAWPDTVLPARVHILTIMVWCVISLARYGATSTRVHTYYHSIVCHQTGQIRCYQHACTYLLSWYCVSSDWPDGVLSALVYILTIMVLLSSAWPDGVLPARVYILTIMVLRVIRLARWGAISTRVHTYYNGMVCHQPGQIRCYQHACTYLLSWYCLSSDWPDGVLSARVYILTIMVWCVISLARYGATSTRVYLLSWYWVSSVWPDGVLSARVYILTIMVLRVIRLARYGATSTRVYLLSWYWVSSAWPDGVLSARVYILTIMVLRVISLARYGATSTRARTYYHGIVCHQTGQIRCYQHACTYLLSWYCVSSDWPDGVLPARVYILTIMVWCVISLARYGATSMRVHTYYHGIGCHQSGQMGCYQHACTYLLSWYGVSSAWPDTVLPACVYILTIMVLRVIRLARYGATSTRVYLLSWYWVSSDWPDGVLPAHEYTYYRCIACHQTGQTLL